MDFLTRAQRSIRMAAIRGRSNKTTELILLSLLRRHRIWGWRRHLPLAGRPDFTFKRQKVVIFIDGCFWHGCPKHYRPPSTNRKFWHKKVEANRARDLTTSRMLKKQGWSVLRFREHDLKQGERVLKRIQSALIAND